MLPKDGVNISLQLLKSDILFSRIPSSELLKSYFKYLSQLPKEDISKIEITMVYLIAYLIDNDAIEQAIDCTQEILSGKLISNPTDLCRKLFCSILINKRVYDKKLERLVKYVVRNKIVFKNLSILDYGFFIDFLISIKMPFMPQVWDRIMPSIEDIRGDGDDRLLLFSSIICSSGNRDLIHFFIKKTRPGTVLKNIL